jgi:protein-S-isoprenylcysteine O-methyltransferase Ste14
MDQILITVAIWFLPGLFVSFGAAMVMKMAASMENLLDEKNLETHGDDLLRANVFSVLAVGVFLLLFYVETTIPDAQRGWLVVLAFCFAVVLGIIGFLSLADPIRAHRVQEAQEREARALETTRFS